MTESGYAVLLVDGDARVRARLTDQLAPLGCTVIQAEDGPAALRVLRENDVRVVLTELYLKTGESDCLIRAVRRSKALRTTRTLAHTRHGTSPDRDWAMKSGADAFLIQPTRPARLRYVVARLAAQKAPSPEAPTASTIIRRDSLDGALSELEGGSLKGASSIIFGREWWVALSSSQQSGYRKRARTTGVSLRSDSLLSDHFVEVRGPSHIQQGLSSERPESPYRR